MASLFQKALVYLGLVDEEQSSDQLEPEPVPATISARNQHLQIKPPNAIEGRRVEPPPATTRTTAFRADDRSGPAYEVQSDIIVMEEFGDAKILADRVRDRVPAVLDLRRTDPDLVRRIIDFASGLIYALDGTMTKTAEGVVLVLPPRVGLSRAEKERLASLGLYEARDG